MVQKVFDGTEDEGQWSPQFMADVAEEGRLCPVQFSKSFRAFSFRLVPPHVGKTGRNLSRQERYKVAVGGIKRPVRIEPCDQKARWDVLTLLTDRHEYGLSRGLFPHSCRKVGESLVQIVNDQRGLRA